MAAAPEILNMSSGTMSRAGRSAIAVSAAMVAAALSGCGTSQGPRPKVPTTAAQLFGSDPAYELDFYDRLDRLPVVSYDDAIHSVLLLNGQSASSYPQRVAMAKQQGLLEENFDHPPREAVTIGEVAVMVERVMTDRVDQSFEGATSRLASRGILPESARASQGLTGSQMLAVLGAAEDLMAAQPEGMATDEPLVVEPSARPAPAPEPAPAAGEPAAPDEDAFAGFETGGEPAKVVSPEDTIPSPAPAAPDDEQRVVKEIEPLPEMPDEAPQTKGEPEPVAPAPEPAPAPPVAVEPAPEPEPAATPAEPEEPSPPAAADQESGHVSKWVPGKPLRQGGR
jgi:hypothetical protein